MTDHLLSRAALSCAVLGILVTISVPITGAQSLGDVARREAERRKQVTSGRVYTDDDLASQGASALPESPKPIDGSLESTEKTETLPPASQAQASANPSGTEPVIVKGREKRDEQYWRALARDLRGRAARAASDLAAREARIAEIDGSPQTPTLTRERELLAAGLPRLQRDARSLTEELTRFLTRAQMANVPDDWIR